jgi:hypothetical protein
MLEAPARLGGLEKRERPDYGPRPTWLFVAAFTLTIAWVALAVYLSAPWRSDLVDAIGPIAAWVIPTLIAYIPALIIGFLAFTLILSPYRPPVLAPPEGDWPDGEWPPVTIVVAAWNEEDVIGQTLGRIARLSYPARSRSCWRTTTRRTGQRIWQNKKRSGKASAIGASSSRRRASTERSTPPWPQ